MVNDKVVRAMDCWHQGLRKWRGGVWRAEMLRIGVMAGLCLLVRMGARLWSWQWGRLEEKIIEERGQGAERPGCWKDQPHGYGNHLSYDMSVRENDHILKSYRCPQERRSVGKVFEVTSAAFARDTHPWKTSVFFRLSPVGLSFLAFALRLLLLFHLCFLLKTCWSLTQLPWNKNERDFQRCVWEGGEGDREGGDGVSSECILGEMLCLHLL